MAEDAPSTPNILPSSQRLNALTLTRQQFYDLVWSKPMVQVAADFGMSDVAIAKRCKVVQVPVPPRGYWAKIAAGHKPARTPLPKYRDSSQPRERPRTGVILQQHTQVSTEPAVRFGPRVVAASNPAAKSETSVPPPDPQRAALDARLGKLPHSPDAQADWLPDANGEATPTHWPDRIRTPARLPYISTHSRSSEKRARRILSRLIEIAIAVGWRFQAQQNDEPQYGYRIHNTGGQNSEVREAHFIVEGELMKVWIGERQLRSDHVLTEDEQARIRRKEYVHPPRWDFKPSGELTVHVVRFDYRAEFASFKDSPHRKLEHRITDLLHALLGCALAIQQDRASAIERARLSRLEDERRAALAETRKAHQTLIDELERQAGAWHRARMLRHYVRAARRAVGNAPIVRPLQNEAVDFLDFAERYINQIDPLHASVRSWQMQRQTSRYSPNTEQHLHNSQSRLTGVEWQDASKLVATHTEIKDDDSEDEP